MSQPMIVWTSIVVLMVVALVIRAAEKIRKSKHIERHRKMIEIGKESDMFYCPGDKYDIEDSQ
ncbi:MAG: hypothetical protein ACI4C3_02040 [Bacteroides sp.]